MPFYQYTIHKGDQRSDLVASDLPDDAAALRQAAEIIRDLKENHAPAWWNGWTLRVTADGRNVSEISFLDAK
jgi:hypothetical protein